jgi:hypothetical protein
MGLGGRDCGDLQSSLRVGTRRAMCYVDPFQCRPTPCELMTIRSPFAALAVLVCGATHAHAYDVSISQAFASVSLSLPTPNMVVVCHGFGCDRRTVVGLSAGDRARLADILAGGRASADAERRAVAAATAWFDRRVGPAAGTTHRIARANGMTQQAGQMDCIDTSRNNTGLFLILDQLHLLHHHKVEAPEARGFLLDGRGPHATAVLTDIHTGRKWAIDNWTRKYGEQPEVMPLDKWMSGG